MAEEPGCAASDVLVSVTTPSFDIFGLELYLPLLCGGRVVIAARETDAPTPAPWRPCSRAKGATLMQATPATWRLLLASGWAGRPGLKALCGGEGAAGPDLASASSARWWASWGTSTGRPKPPSGRLTRRIDPERAGPKAASTRHARPADRRHPGSSWPTATVQPPRRPGRPASS